MNQRSFYISNNTYFVYHYYLPLGTPVDPLVYIITARSSGEGLVTGVRTVEESKHHKNKTRGLWAISLTSKTALPNEHICSKLSLYMYQKVIKKNMWLIFLRIELSFIWTNLNPLIPMMICLRLFHNIDWSICIRLFHNIDWSICIKLFHNIDWSICQSISPEEHSIAWGHPLDNRTRGVVSSTTMLVY